MSEIAKGLRELADFIDAEDGEIGGRMSAPTMNIFLPLEEQREELAKAARWIGAAEKIPFGDFYLLRRKFAGGVKLDVIANRDKVCERRVVGTRRIPRRIVPAHEEEIVEWDCPDSILGGH